MEMQNIHDNQNNLEKKKKWRLLPDLKTCCKATVNKTMYHEDRKASQRNKIDQKLTHSCKN